MYKNVNVVNFTWATLYYIFSLLAIDYFYTCTCQACTFLISDSELKSEVNVYLLSHSCRKYSFGAGNSGESHDRVFLGICLQPIELIHVYILVYISSMLQPHLWCILLLLGGLSCSASARFLYDGEGPCLANIHVHVYVWFTNVYNKWNLHCHSNNYTKNDITSPHLYMYN